MNGLGFPVAAIVSAAATLLPYFLGNKNKASSAQSAQSAQSTQNTQTTPQETRIIVVQQQKNYTKYIAIVAACLIGYLIINEKK